VELSRVKRVGWKPLYTTPQPKQEQGEAVLVVEKERDYVSNGHFYKGTKPKIDPTKVWKLPIGTKLYTTPQPKQGPVALETVYETIIHWDEGGGKRSRRELAMRIIALYATPQPKQEQGEPFEYWNAVEGWVKLDEVREHFDSVSCATIYKNGGEGRVPLSLAQPKQKQGVKKRPVESDYLSYTSYTRALEAYCDEQEHTTPQRKPLSDEQWQVMADTLHCAITRRQKNIIESVLGIKE